MTIQYLSDLHFEFPQNRKWLKENPIIPKGDILLVAGDTYHLGNQFTDPWLWDELSEKFQQVIVIPGNHEYYGKFDIATALHSLHIDIRKNITLVHNKAISYQGIHFICSTLWSKIEQFPLEVHRGLYDFRVIKFAGQPLSIAQFNQLHEASLTFLNNALATKPNEPCIVMTHHLPSLTCNAEEFKGSLLNEGFCVDLTPLIQKHHIDAWVYGHSHRNLSNFDLHGTQMLTNQLGYISFGEHGTFRRDATFKIKTKKYKQ